MNDADPSPPRPYSTANESTIFSNSARSPLGFGHLSIRAKLLAITLGAPWIPPYEPNLDWMVPAAALFLVIPFFFVSVAIEAPVFQRVTGCSRDAPWRWSCRANVASYGCLLVIVPGVPVYALATHRQP